MKPRLLALALMGPLIFSNTAYAQDEGLRLQLMSLLTRGVVSDPTPAGTAGFPHTGHFQFLEADGRQQTSADFLIAASFGAVVGSQLLSFPVGASAAGFTYVTDATTGAAARGTNSFGSTFAERAQTIGRGKWNIGFNYQALSFDSFAGKDLDDGSIRFYLRHNDCCPGQIPNSDPATGATPVGDGNVGNPFFEGDIIEARVRLDLSVNTFIAFANYGITDAFDVGIALPIVNVDMEANMDATIERLATAGAPGIHRLQNGQTQATFTESGGATGIGDISMRGKYNFMKRERGGLAAAVDLRLPTGDEDDFLGSGTTQVRFSFVASTEFERFAPHVNLGYIVSSGEDDDDEGLFGDFDSSPNEFQYLVGAEFLVAPRLTLYADLIGRTLIDAGTMEDQTREFSFRTANDQPLQTTTRVQLVGEPGSLNLLHGGFGAKFNIPNSNALLYFSFLVPFTDNGLRDKFTPFIGFDYSF